MRSRPDGEPGQADPTGMALNLSSSEVATALNAALKGDCSRLSQILVSLGKQIPDARTTDPMWQSLSNNPEFRGLGEMQGEVQGEVCGGVRRGEERDPGRS